MEVVMVGGKCMPQESSLDGDDVRFHGAREKPPMELFAPRAPALNLLTARGGLETTFQTKK